MKTIKLYEALAYAGSGLRDCYKAQNMGGYKSQAPRIMELEERIFMLETILGLTVDKRVKLVDHTSTRLILNVGTTRFIVRSSFIFGFEVFCELEHVPDLQAILVEALDQDVPV